MAMDQEDLELLNTLKTTRQNITALELGGSEWLVAWSNELALSHEADAFH